MAEQSVQTAAESNGTASQFRHQALPDPKTYIRLLKVRRIAIGDTTTKLTCKLTTWHVDDAPSYHAISYVWGDSNVTTKVKVNGKDLQITVNADYALRQSRWFGARYVWIDSISIAQSDGKEKGHQVGIMGDIYRRASCVLSCVGPHSENSEMLMRIPCKLPIPLISSQWNFKSAYYNSRVLFPYRKPLEMLGLFVWSVQAQNFGKEKMFSSLYSFVQRPYFTRLWVMQEVTSNKNIIVCCGVDHRPITDLFDIRNMLSLVMTLDDSWFRLSLRQRLVDTVFFPRATLLLVLGDKRGNLPSCMHLERGGGCKNICHGYLKYSSFFSPGASLTSLMWFSRDLECQDPRDKIYGLLSIVEWPGIPPIVPDYEIGIFDVALKVMEKIQKIQDDKTLHLAESFNRSLSLHLSHETPKNTTLEHHTMQEVKSEDLISQYSMEFQWFSCEITKDHKNIWKLGIEFDSLSHPDREGCKHKCAVHGDKTRCQRRFSFGNLESRIPNEYIQIKDHKGNLMALLPQGTNSGDVLLGAWIEKKTRRTPRYLVLRKGESGYHSIVGQAIVEGACAILYDLNRPWFLVHYDNRDALNLVISWAQYPAYEEQDLSLMTWDMAKELLDLKVCNQPFSSYAIERQDQFDFMMHTLMDPTCSD